MRRPEKGAVGRRTIDRSVSQSVTCSLVGCPVTRRPLRLSGIRILTCVIEQVAGEMDCGGPMVTNNSALKDVQAALSRSMAETLKETTLRAECAGALEAVREAARRSSSPNNTKEAETSGEACNARDRKPKNAVFDLGGNNGESSKYIFGLPTPFTNNPDVKGLASQGEWDWYGRHHRTSCVAVMSVLCLG
jgi:hypothetical protein